MIAKQIVSGASMLGATLLTAALLLAQAPQPDQGKAKRDPKQSPAPQPRLKTATPQTYTAEQIRAGELRFGAQCGFCHGRDAAGGEQGPDLTRSELIAQDVRGDKVGPLVRAGRVDAGMPSFKLSDSDLTAIVAYIHQQMDEASTLGGGRR